MPDITMRGKNLEYQVRESSRAERSRIDVDLDGITVVVPEGRDIDPQEFLKQKEDWVLDKFSEVEDFLSKVPDRKIEFGGTLPIRGEEKDIVEDESGPKIEDGAIRMPPTDNLSDDIESFLREEARS
ncbi:MAG: hypothetical protein ABEJ72_01180, partial [Candidatus Aenigmatarchaeota archaeon]